MAEDTNKTYRRSGSAYVEISASIALGETASTAYAGNKGKANADAIAALQSGKANKVHTHPISDITNLQSSLNAKANSNDVYKKTEIDTKLNGKVNTSDFEVATDEEIKSLLEIS